MPALLEGSCRCGAVAFSCRRHTPYPYQRCYCSICRKIAGGGGFAINIGAQTSSLQKHDASDAIRTFRAEIRQGDGACELSSAQRHFCSRCATALWLFSPEWPDLIHPFAAAIDTDLLTPPSSVHMMLQFKPGWVSPDIRDGDETFDLYPAQSLEDWHRARGLWVD